MHVNKLLMDIMRSEWLMSFEGLTAYAPIAHKIITGESLNIGNKTSAIVTILDDNGKKVLADKDNGIVVPRGSVAVIDMIGPVIKYGDFCTYGADEIVNALRLAMRTQTLLVLF